MRRSSQRGVRVKRAGVSEEFELSELELSKLELARSLS